MVRRGGTRGKMGGGAQDVTYRHSLLPPPITSPPGWHHHSAANAVSGGNS